MMKGVPYQVKEAVLAIAIIGATALGLDWWGHEPIARYALIFGAIALFAWMHFFVLARHKGPKVRSWLSGWRKNRSENIAE